MRRVRLAKMPMIARSAGLALSLLALGACEHWDAWKTWEGFEDSWSPPPADTPAEALFPLAVIAGALVGDIERTRGSALDPRKEHLRSMFTDCEAIIWTVGALGGRRPKPRRDGSKSREITRGQHGACPRGSETPTGVS